MREKDFHLKRPLLLMDILLLYIDINVYPCVKKQNTWSDLFFVIYDSVLSNYFCFRSFQLTAGTTSLV